MKVFKEYIVEGKGLHVFDIDETLFKTNAKIRVRDKSGKLVKVLTNQEFNDHKLQTGQHYDFSEFRNAKKFHDESEPISPMIDKLNAIHNNIKAGNHNSKIIMNTARADFDDKDTVLNKFRKHGIDVDNTHIHRAGNVPGNDSPAEKKNVILRKHLNTGNYDHVHMYDDSKTNLEQFLKLQKEYPKVKFHAHHVSHEGRTKKLKVNEASYVGNIGIMELIKFHSKATPEQKKKFDNLVKSKKNKEAWDMIQDVTGIKLHKSVHEEHGAGEDGSSELRKKYQKDTPGQKVKSFADYVNKK
jgi:cell fate (sporulation/competence/biofilm development) regulator YlbF (YheA/YmcA/DUF963 family)